MTVGQGIKSSPHIHVGHDTAWIMRQVIYASLPGVAALCWWFGPGVLVNIAIAMTTAALCEAAALCLRRRPLRPALGDCSALVTGLLLGVALPPGAPIWLVCVGTVFALLLGKHAYGGLGYNPFNPAMAGYVFLLISFPVEMTRWAAPSGVDALTMATPLDVFKQNDSLLVSDLWRAQANHFGVVGAYGWEWANLGFLIGGLYLLSRRIFTWHAPFAMLVMLALLSAMFYDSGGSGSAGSPFFHLFSGATMLGAFFILTDPVSSATTLRGKLIFGAGAGALIFIIRVWGNYPDAVAFGVLLMNFVAPLIDYYSMPRTYGH